MSSDRKLAAITCLNIGSLGETAVIVGDGVSVTDCIGGANRGAKQEIAGKNSHKETCDNQH